MLAARRLVLARISAFSTFGLNLILIKSTFAQPCSTSCQIARNTAGAAKRLAPFEKRAADAFFGETTGSLESYVMRIILKMGLAIVAGAGLAAAVANAMTLLH